MLEKYQTIEECIGSNGKLLEILKMRMSKHEQVDSVEAMQKTLIGKKYDAHDNKESFRPDSQLTNEKKNLELNQKKKTQQNYNNKIQ